MPKAKEYLVAFLLGGVIYSAIEVIFRGFTHWSMTVVGGICLMIIYRRYVTHPDDNILMRCLFGMTVITSLEFISGCIVNIMLGWNVWDYSNMYLNFLGQICPTFSAAWFWISILAAYMCKLINDRMGTPLKSS